MEKERNEKMILEREVRWNKVRREFQVAFTLKGMKNYDWPIKIKEDYIFEKMNLNDPYTMFFVTKDIEEIEKITNEIIKTLKRLKQEDEANEKIAKELSKIFLVEN
jgi:hypothetical protein